VVAKVGEAPSAGAAAVTSGSAAGWGV